MCLHATLAHKPASAAEASGVAFLTLVTPSTITGAHLLERITDVKEMMDVEGSLEAGDSATWQFYLLTTAGAPHALPPQPHASQILEAALTEDVEAVEELRSRVGLEAYPTGDLVLHFLESLLSHSGGLGSGGLGSGGLGSGGLGSGGLGSGRLGSGRLGSHDLNCQQGRGWSLRVRLLSMLLLCYNVATNWL